MADPLGPPASAQAAKAAERAGLIESIYDWRGAAKRNHTQRFISSQSSARK